MNRTLTAIAAMLLIACQASPPTSPEAMFQGTVGLASLMNSHAHRDEWILQYGAPSATFENGRVHCWRLRHDEEAFVPVMVTHGWEHGDRPEWSLDMISLVVVFDERGCAQRCSLVDIRSD